MSDQVDRLHRVLDDAVEQVSEAAGAVYDGARSFLVSEEGRRLRTQLATGLIALAPAIGSMPAVRRTPLGRLITLAGGTAILVKAAEAIRDWEPAESPPAP